MDRSRVEALSDDEVERLGAGRLDVRPRRVEVRVVGDDLAGSADDREEDLLRRPALVRRDDVTEREQVLDRLEEREPRGRPGIRLVAVLDRGPLVPAHRAGPRIGQEIDQDVVGMEREEIAAGGLEGRFALRPGRDPDRFHGVDAERLDDRPELVHRGEHSRAAVP
jgi:hypothetical protein